MTTRSHNNSLPVGASFPATLKDVQQTQQQQHVELLATSDAANFYTRRCVELGQNTNPTFLKQLLSGTVIFEFDNGYLGNHGIVPIVETLQRVPLQELLLPKCALTASDYIILCDALNTHPTLQHIDLRGNTVEVTSAKKILMLVGRNTTITELDLDESTPKYAAIQQQLARNRRQPFTMDKCLVCGKAVRYAPQDETERRVLSAIVDLYSPVQYAVSAVEFEVLFRLLQRCCEQGRGLLFLCSGQCLEALVGMLYASARCVLKACHFHVDYTLPRLSWLHTQTQRLITEVDARGLDAGQFEAPPRAAEGGTVKRGAAADTSAARDVTTYFDGTVDVHGGDVCTVCGKETATLAVGPSLLLEHLAKDVRAGAPLGPSALLRLVRVFAAQSQIRPCGRKCSKHVARYALLGFGGVVRRQPTGSVPLLSSVGLPMTCSTADFTLLDFDRELVDSTDDEDTVCARGVASVVGDVDNVRVDPYFVFAAGRKLRKQAASTFGVELQAACEAICLIGCVESQDGAFAQDDTSASTAARPARHAYSSWDAWATREEARCGAGTVAAWLRKAFSHRRSGFYQVDGPHRNSVFDNVRAALWAFRRQRRSVLTTMKFAVDWLSLKDGVVPDTCPPKGGFYTCVKVVGQCAVDNEFRLIVQGFFGPTAGHSGYFYLSKYMFNISVKEGAYMFVDGAALYATEAAGVSGEAAAEAAAAPVGRNVAVPEAVRAVAGARACERAVTLLSRTLTDGFVLSTTETAPLRQLLASLPLSGAAAATLDTRAAQTLWESSAAWRVFQRSLAHHPLPSQLLFALSELIGADGVAWILDNFTAADALPATALDPVVALEAQAARKTGSELSSSSSHQQTQPAIDWQVVKRNSTGTAFDGDGDVLLATPIELIRPAPPAAPRSASRKKRSSAGEGTTVAKASPQRLRSPIPPAGRSGSRKRDTQSASGSRPTSPPSEREEGGLRGAAAKEWKSDDPRQHLLAQLWAIERLQQTPAAVHAQAATRSNAALFRPNTLPTAAPLAPEHWHQRWAAMRLCKPLADSTAVFTSLVLLIMGDSFAVYDTQTLAAVVEEARLVDHPLTRGFPFPAGCDALVHHPLRPHEVYVFASSFWAVWDACAQATVSGPFELSRHAQFRQLPPAFLDGVDGAIPAFGTPLVLFFKDAAFVLFDVDKACCATEVRHLHSPPPEPPLRAAAAANRGGAGSDAAVSASTLPTLVVDAKLGQSLGTAPLAALPEVAPGTTTTSASTTTSTAVAAQVLTAAGQVARVVFRVATSEGTGQSPVRPTLPEVPSTLPTSVYAGLPTRFQQATTRGAWAVCEALVDDAVRGLETVGNMTFFDPRPLLHGLAERERTLRPGSGRGGASPPPPQDTLDSYLSTTDGTKPHVTTSLRATSVTTSDRELLRLVQPLGPLEDESNALLTHKALLLGEVDAEKATTHNAMASADVGGAPPAYVTLHLGRLHEEAFGGVVLVLDTATAAISADVLQLAPIRAVVESSLDDAGLVFQRRGVLSASAPVSLTTWSECHVARHWRLRFESAMPAGLGVVRVLWLRTQWRVVESAVAVLERLSLASVDVRVHVEASEVLADAPERWLANGEGGGLRVSDAPWYAPHAVLPLLTPTQGPTATQPCLVFCGEHFAELDLVTGEVAGRRACALRTHPAFCGLPAPFASGVDAIFYPPRSVYDDVVVLVTRGWQLHWNLRLGQAEGQIVRCSEGYFKGLPVDFSQVDSLSNVWETHATEGGEAGRQATEDGAAPVAGRTHAVCVAFRVQLAGRTESRVLQWSLVDQRVERGPCPVREWPALNHDALAEAPIQCLFLTPTGDTHAFSNGLHFHHASASTAGPATPGVPVSEHPLWYRLGWYLPHFATARRGTSITVDLLGRTHAVLGLRLTSAEADQRRWRVAYSDDLLSWHDLPGSHCQADTTVDTVWRPSDIGYQSHRFWRLCTAPADDAAARTPACAYTGLSLLVLPSTRQHGTPERVSSSGTSMLPIETVLLDHSTDRTIAFDAGSEVATLVPAAYAATHPGLPTRVHHVTLDYGSATPVLLTGVSCEVGLRDHNTALTWTILCADDDRDASDAASTWHVCSVSHTSLPMRHVEWIAARPRRFWRIEVSGDAGRGSWLAGQWSLHRYCGPLVVPRLATSVVHTLVHAVTPPPVPQPSHRDPAFALLLAPPVRQGADGAATLSETEAIVHLPSQPGSALEIDMSASAAPLALAGVDLVCTSPTCRRATLQLQRSGDGSAWAVVAEMQWYHGAPVTVCRAANSSVGAARYWRLYVLHADDAYGTLCLHRLGLVTAKPHLYRSFYTMTDGAAASLTSGDMDTSTDVSTLSLTAPLAVCQVQATLPPCSVYQVERLSLDGVTWETVAVLDNSSVTHHKCVRRGWASLTPSTSWRVRSLTPVLGGSSAVLASVLGGGAQSGGGNALSGEVCWSAFAGVQPVRVSLRHLAGLVMTSTGFTEIEPIRQLCADENGPVVRPVRPRSVLRCVVPAEPAPLVDPLIVWQFASPTALHQVVLIVHVTTAAAPATEDTPVARVMVESSANGIDYVAVADVPLLPSRGQQAQKHLSPVSLSWDPSNASCAALEQLFWRVRFEALPRHGTLDVVRAEWFTLDGVPVAASSALSPLAAVATTNTAFAQWKQQSFNGEVAFCAQCRLGLDEARSLDSKLRDAADYSRAGETAAVVLAKSKRFQKFIVKLAKNTSPGIPQLPESVFLASGADRFRDLQYFVEQCGHAYPDSRFDELVPLVGQPLPLRDLIYSKKSSAWFYPRFEVHGSVSEPFYGIPRTQASFAVLWSLSFDLQRHADLCEHPDVSDVSPHVASPLVVVNIAQKDWQAAKSFPGLPLLYHVGFTACPLTVVFALNEVTFTETYCLPMPDGKPIPTAFPFSVYPGVNFVRRMPVAACPATVFDHLRHFVTPNVLESEQVVVVFTAPSLQSRTATVRFTLPASTLNLGVPGLSMDALQFEFTLTTALPEESPFTAKNLATLRAPLSPRPGSGSFSASFNGSEGTGLSPHPALLAATANNNNNNAETGSVSGTSSIGSPMKRRKGRKGAGKSAHSTAPDITYRIQLTSRGARYEPAGASEGSSSSGVPVSVLGELRAHCTGAGAPRIDVTCASQSGRLPVTVLRRQGATLTDLAFSTVSTLDWLRGPRGFATSTALTLQATLSLPFAAAYPCSCQVPAVEGLSALVEPEELRVLMVNVTLAEVLALLRWLFVDGHAFTAQFPPAEEAWVQALPLSLSLELALHRATRRVSGHGSLSFGGSAAAQDVVFTASVQGWNLSCTVSRLTLGELRLQCRRGADHAATPVSLRMEGTYGSLTTTSTTATPAASPASVRLTACGEVALLGDGSATNLTVEISPRGTFATARTATFDLTIEDLSAYTHLHGALQIRLQEGVLLPMIRAAVAKHPLVTSLLAAGLAMHLTPEELYVRSREATPARRLTVCFRGVLFGTWFDVVVPIAQLHTSPRANEPLCEALAAEVVEQCAASLWASYANLVGRAVPPAADTRQDAIPAAMQQRHVRLSEQGTFLALWASKECDRLDHLQ